MNDVKQDTQRTAIAPFPLIDTSGAPFERGVQYGRQAGDRIARSVEIYERAVALAGRDWDEALRRVRRYMPKVEAFDAELTAEMEGIAKGAERRLEEIGALNARTELLYGGDDAAGDDAEAALEGGCTGRGSKGARFIFENANK